MSDWSWVDEEKREHELQKKNACLVRVGKKKRLGPRPPTMRCQQCGDLACEYSPLAAWYAMLESAPGYKGTAEYGFLKVFQYRCCENHTWFDWHWVGRVVPL